MIHLYKYRSLSETAAGLAAALSTFEPADPLAGQTVIVPNMDTARWLKLELAEINGISANLSLILPSDWQYRQIRKLNPDLPKKLPSDILPMTWSLFELLSEESVRRRYPLLNNYIRRQGAGNRETAAWQLSSKIASVLDQYLVYRPELLLSWQSGNAGSSTDEQWQAKLWNHLNSRWKGLSDPGFGKNRAELHRELIRALQQGEIECHEPLFVFNPGLVPGPVLNSIRHYSEHQQVLFHYCTPIQPHMQNRAQVENPFLDSFGREALDLEQLYGNYFGPAVPGGNMEPNGPGETGGSAGEGGHGEKRGFTERLEHAGTKLAAVPFSQSEPAGINPGSRSDESPLSTPQNRTVLRRIQQSVRKNEPLGGGSTQPPGRVLPHSDRSIRIHSCHSPLREIETLHQSLLEMFEEDETLSPDDVLVATPDPTRYEPFIRAVFGTEEAGLPHIPWHLGSNGNRENVVEKCLRLWLDLPDSRFRVQPVLDLFSMQLAYEALGIGESEVNEVRGWIAENNVMWGIDSDHREQVGQPPSDSQTWHSAMKRGWLGQLMADEAGQFYQDTLLYAGIRTSAQKEAWAAFSHYLNRLSRARQEIQTERTGSGWCSWIEGQLMELIGAEPFMQQEGSAVRRVLDLVRESCETAGCGGEVSFSMIRSVIGSLLDQTGSAGALFTRGVTFSSMVPVRSIPFRVIALIGLNEGSFPRKETVIDFDLMARQPEPGERNRKHEDRNLFLESVLSAGDIHYLSYVGQSPVDNEVIPPSTVVTEWIDLVSTVIGLKSDELVQKEALHLFSESYFRRGEIYSGLAHRTAANLQNGDKPPSGLLPDLAKGIAGEQEKEFTLDRFIRFFRSPLKAFVTDRMGAFLSSPGEEQDEFSLNSLERHLLFQQMMGWLIAGREERDIKRLIRNAGLVPDGWVGDNLISELLAHCKTALNFLNSRGEEPQFSELNIDLEIGELSIHETLLSFREDSLLDIEASRLSGAMVMQSWIRHLIWQLSSGVKVSSNLLAELKKGDPKWIVFKPSENPEEMLRKLISLYQKGVSEPLLFFPKSLYAFKENERNGKHETECVQSAAAVFEGNDFNISGERSDLSIQLLLGPDAPFDPAWLKEDFIEVMNDLFEHLEGI